MSRLLDDSQRDRRRPPEPAPPERRPFAPSNRALSAALSREVGWKGARKGSANAEERTVEAADQKHAVKRIPISGIKGKGLPERAIVVLPAFRDADATSLDVLLHLHGFTPGYATGDDLGTYDIEGQMAAAGKSLMAILPQGNETSDFNGGQAGKALLGNLAAEHHAVVRGMLRGEANEALALRAQAGQRLGQGTRSIGHRGHQLRP